MLSIIRRKSQTRVLLFTPKFPPFQGGAATYYSNLIDKSEDDIEFIVITAYSNSNDIFKEDENVIIRIIPFIQTLPMPLRFVLEGIITFIASLIAIVLWKPDIAHIHSTAIGTPAVGVACSIFRVPIIYDCRDNDFLSWVVKIGPVAYWCSCATSITNRLVRNEVPRELIIQAPVQNPDYVAKINEDVTRPDDDTFRLIFAGSVRKEKGVHKIIEAVDQLDLENVELCIVGDGEDKEALQDRSGSNVTFTGFIPHEYSLERIKRSDVLLLPSESEGRPRVILEAFELGTPVIATPVGDITDMIEDYETGVLVSQSVDDITKAILKLHNNRNLWGRISEQAQEGMDTSSDFTGEIIGIYRKFK